MGIGFSCNSTTSESWEQYWQHFEDVGYVNYTPQLLETLGRHVNLQGANVLEIGSGTGGNASKLARQGAIVTTLDFAPTALERTRATGHRAGVRILLAQADARDLPFASASFDAIYHQGFLEHFTDPDVLLIEQRRILKSGGYLLVDVPQLYNLYTVYKRHLIRSGQWPYGGWEREFSYRELHSLMRSIGFEILDSYGRGYFPRLFEMVRNLSKVESKLLKRCGPPSRIWQAYDAVWQWFEQTWLGCNTLQCIGVMARAVD